MRRVDRVRRIGRMMHDVGKWGGYVMWESGGEGV